jgi:hypothetical protein
MPASVTRATLWTVVTGLTASLVLLALQGPPLIYWGAHPAAIRVTEPDQSSIEEVRTMRTADSVVLRFSWKLPVEDLVVTASGEPVSGRLRATLYWDVDGFPLTGIEMGRSDLRTGSEFRLEVGVVAMGEDPSEHRTARPLLVATLYRLNGRGGQAVVWRTDADQRPRNISARGTWLDLRLPAELINPSEDTRLVLVQDGVATSGRFRP